MNGQAVGAEIATADEVRMLRARLDFLVVSLPVATWANPTWAALSVLPFTGIVPMFGTIAPWRMIVAVGLHVVCGFVAAWLSREYRRTRLNASLWLRRIVAFQAAIGASWGLFVWLLWVSGNPVNNVLVVLVIVAILWVYSYTRAMHTLVLLAGVTPTAVLAIACFIYRGGALVWPLTAIVGVTYVLSCAFAHFTRLRVDSMIRTRFANDDLAIELRQARDEALRKRFEAEAANASKTTFLANMSHELRTPLNAILGFSDLIANETLGPVGTARYREYATDINSSGAHLLILINDILDIAKIEAGKMEIEPRILDPKTVIENALLVILARARERRQHVSIDIERDKIGLLADERALKQMVINLMSNAVKFTPEGGNIQVAGRRTADHGYQLCVQDDGPGIPGELLERIFTPFNQVDNRYNRQAGGTGLGLSLVRGLVELHGGRAWIESGPASGVRAFVYFPPAARIPVSKPEDVRRRA